MCDSKENRAKFFNIAYIDSDSVISSCKCCNTSTYLVLELGIRQQRKQKIDNVPKRSKVVLLITTYLIVNTLLM